MKSEIIQILDCLYLYGILQTHLSVYNKMDLSTHTLTNMIELFVHTELISNYISME